MKLSLIGLGLFLVVNLACTVKEKSNNGITHTYSYDTDKPVIKHEIGFKGNRSPAIEFEFNGSRSPAIVSNND